MPRLARARSLRAALARGGALAVARDALRHLGTGLGRKAVLLAVSDIYQPPWGWGNNGMRSGVGGPRNAQRLAVRSGAAKFGQCLAPPCGSTCLTFCSRVRWGATPHHVQVSWHLVHPLVFTALVFLTRHYTTAPTYHPHTVPWLLLLLGYTPCILRLYGPRTSSLTPCLCLCLQRPLCR